MFQVCQCKNVHQYLAESRRVASNQTSGSWLFRGQADSTWGLVPGLLRKHACSNPKVFEKNIIEDMRRSLKGRTTLPDRLLDDDDFILGFAQHYGVKTRLLDWSVDPMIALYFALSGVLSGPRETENCSVFAIATLYLRGATEKVVSPVPAANPNLVAQKGVLTKASWKLPPLWDENTATRQVETVKVSGMTYTRLMRFDLSRSVVNEAFDYLRKVQINATVLFPSEHGLAQDAVDVTNRVLFDTPEGSTNSS